MLLLLTLACTTPDPLAGVAATLGRPLTADERAVFPDQGVWIWVDGDHIHLDTLGVDTAFAALDAPNDDLSPRVDLPLVDGRVLPADRRGLLITPLYDALLGRALVHRAAFDAHPAGAIPEFEGRYTLLIGPDVSEDALTGVIYTAGQAMYGAPRAALFGEPVRPPDRPLPAPPPGDETHRDDPLAPGWTGLLDGEPAYTVDLRGARMRFDVPTAQTDIPPSAPETMLALLRQDPGNPVLFPGEGAAWSAAPNPVLRGIETFIERSKTVEEDLLVRLARAYEDDRSAWVGAARDHATAHQLPTAAAWLDGAEALGAGGDPYPPSVAEFLADPAASRPLGLWSAAPDTRRIFRRDRWLQQELHEPALVHELAAVVTDPALAADLARWRAHRDRWTNPSVLPLVDGQADCAPCRGFLFGPGRSFETAFAKSADLAPGQSLTRTWVAALKDGRATLELQDDAGWYDRNIWALAPILTPDSRIEAAPGYVKRLEDAFLAAVAARRETQVKDLELPTIGAAMRPRVATVAPNLRIEPVPAHYRRQAEVYDWVLARLAEEPWDTAHHAWAMRDARDAYRWFAAMAEADLGGTPTPVDTAHLPPGGEGDVRRMVPLAKDAATGKWICMATLGMRHVELVVSWATPPVVTALDDQPLHVDFVDARYTLITPYVVEVLVDEPLDRARMRALGDANPTARAFVRALEGG